MLQKIKLFFATLAAAMAIGCGHNAIQYSDGIGLNAGFDPEHMTASLTLRYGKILSVAVRDMAEVEMTGEATGGSDASQASATTSGGIRIRIDRQANGYTRDLIAAGATAEQLRALFNPSPASPDKNDSSGSAM